METERRLSSIFAYENYRDFLRDFYYWRKSQSAFSYRSFSETAGVTSANFLKLVIDGSKNLTVENIHRFARACDLRSHEHEYFECLVHYGQSVAEADRAYYKQKMKQFTPHLSHGKVAGDSVILGDWYYPAVLVTIEDQPVDGDLSLVAKKCGITELQYQECLSRLLEAGLVKPLHGKFSLSRSFLNIENRKATSIRHKQYLEKQLSLSTQIFRSAYARNAKFLSHTFTLRKSSFTQFHDRLHALLDEIDRASDADAGDQVAQLNMQLFLLSERSTAESAHQTLGLHPRMSLS